MKLIAVYLAVKRFIMKHRFIIVFIFSAIYANDPISDQDAIAERILQLLPKIHVNTTVTQVTHVNSEIKYIRGKFVPQIMNQLPNDVQAEFFKLLSPEQRNDFFTHAKFHEFRAWISSYTPDTFEEVRNILHSEGIDLPEHPQLITDLDQIEQEIFWKTLPMKYILFLRHPSHIYSYLLPEIDDSWQKTTTRLERTSSKAALDEYITQLRKTDA